jgi:hypothetical protein
MHSFIVANWNLDPQALQPLLADFPSLHHPDVLLIEGDPSIGIAHIRNLKLWLSRKPYQAKTKLALLLQAHTLTLPAQHALLKSLAEPPPDTIIILATDQPDSLIPTIHSRCALIQGSPRSSQSEVGPEPIQLFNQLGPLTPGQRITSAQNYATKDQALSLCLNWIHHLRSQLKTDPSLAPQLRLLQATHTQLKANVNPKLAMENLFLHLSSGLPATASRLAPESRK